MQDGEGFPGGCARLVAELLPSSAVWLLHVTPTHHSSADTHLQVFGKRDCFLIQDFGSGAQTLTIKCLTLVEGPALHFHPLPLFWAIFAEICVGDKGGVSLVSCDIWEPQDLRMQFQKSCEKGEIFSKSRFGNFRTSSSKFIVKP